MRVCWGSFPCAADFRVSSRPPLSPVVSCDVMYRGQERSHHKQHPSNFLLFLHNCCSKSYIIKENMHQYHAGISSTCTVQGTKAPVLLTFC